ncbi:MAG: DUF4407 domain-containing protein [Epsilonproteobacteria bacterium]|nr:DUF4407 domain-containing protein [Campylobacterota bacterium]
MKEKIYSFFWWFAGVRKDILLKHKNDQERYFQIGLAVFVTMIMAMLTGTIAINIALVGYENALKGEFNPLAILLGIMWGLIIMSMDRTIVVTMQKYSHSPVNPKDDPKWQFLKREVLPAIPRVLLAFLIAKVILDPFEVIYFSEEIAHQMELDKRTQALEDIKKIQEKLSKTNEMIVKNMELRESEKKKREEELNKKIATLKEQLQQLKYPLKEDIETCWSEYQELDEKYNYYRGIEAEEAKTGRGPNWRDAHNNKLTFKRKRDEKRVECEELEKEQKSQYELNKPKIAQIEDQIRELTQKLHSVYSSTTTLNTVDLDKEDFKIDLNISAKGFSSYTKALEAKERLFEQNENFRKFHYLLMSFIFLIEMLPIITKLLTPRGGYDAEMQKISEERALKCDEERERQKIQTSFRIQEEAISRRNNLEIKKMELESLKEKLKEELERERKALEEKRKEEEKRLEEERRKAQEEERKKKEIEERLKEILEGKEEPQKEEELALKWKEKLEKVEEKKEERIEEIDSKPTNNSLTKPN